MNALEAAASTAGLASRSASSPSANAIACKSSGISSPSRERRHCGHFGRLGELNATCCQDRCANPIFCLCWKVALRRLPWTGVARCRPEARSAADPIKQWRSRLGFRPRSSLRRFQSRFFEICAPEPVEWARRRKNGETRQCVCGPLHPAISTAPREAEDKGQEPIAAHHHCRFQSRGR